MTILELFIGFTLSLVLSLSLTPLVSKLAVRMGAVDHPNERKIHVKVMPRIGGLAIIIAFTIGLLVLQPKTEFIWSILAGSFVITITGMVDDLYSVRPIVKFGGQMIAALLVVSDGLLIDKITVPFYGTLEMDFLSIIITLFWIVGVTNAINLIDGLDGLAAGVSSIGLASLAIIGAIDGRIIIVQFSTLLIGACLGFLYHNFYPAKIYMGDTGALFLGYWISIISMLGLFKNVAIFSFILPIFIIAIPIFDTLFAIVRRLISKQSIGQADRKHIHHRLIAMGYSHRKSVLIIYLLSSVFALLAIVYTSVTLQTTLIIVTVLLLTLQLMAELTGFIPENQFFALKFIRKCKYIIKDKWRVK